MIDIEMFRPHLYEFILQLFLHSSAYHYAIVRFIFQFLFTETFITLLTRARLWVIAVSGPPTSGFDRSKTQQLGVNRYIRGPFLNVVASHLLGEVYRRS